ncbi:MAG: Fur family transcriptional regulator [Chloroflexia bacterium]
MVEDRLTEYSAKLVASGVRLTPQRFMVLEVLAANPGHITADRVLASVQRRYAHVNKTTVYRTLDLLTELGMVAQTEMGGNQAEYELLERPHHHLICKKCGMELELPDSTLNPLRRLIEAEHGFVPSFDHFALFGICRDCRQPGET